MPFIHLNYVGRYHVNCLTFAQITFLWSWVVLMIARFIEDSMMATATVFCTFRNVWNTVNWSFDERSVVFFIVHHFAFLFYCFLSRTEISWEAFSGSSASRINILFFRYQCEDVFNVRQFCFICMYIVVLKKMCVLAVDFLCMVRVWNDSNVIQNYSYFACRKYNTLTYWGRMRSTCSPSLRWVPATEDNATCSLRGHQIKKETSSEGRKWEHRRGYCDSWCYVPKHLVAFRVLYFVVVCGSGSKFGFYCCFLFDSPHDILQSMRKWKYEFSHDVITELLYCLLYTSPSPRD